MFEGSSLVYFFSSIESFEWGGGKLQKRGEGSKGNELKDRESKKKQWGKNIVFEWDVGELWELSSRVYSEGGRRYNETRYWTKIFIWVEKEHLRAINGLIRIRNDLRGWSALVCQCCFSVGASNKIIRSWTN